jgi:hypothetical protein
MGFPTSSNGTIAGNGSAISRTGKLRVWVLTITHNQQKTTTTHSTKTSQNHNPQPTRRTSTIPMDDGDYREGWVSSVVVAETQASMSPCCRCHCPTGGGDPRSKGGYNASPRRGDCGIAVAVRAALAQWARLPTRGAWAGAVVPEGVDAACRSKMAPWAIKRAEGSQVRRRTGARRW